MKTRVVGCVFLAILGCAAMYGQVGVWKNHTSMQEVRSVAREGSNLWAATSGGLFRWIEGTQSFLKITTAEGLQSVDLTAVAIDKYGDVWTGTSTGFVHVYSPQTGKWQYIPDLANTSHTNKQINSIVMSGDTALICTNFGLSVFQISKFQFGDTFTKFGNLSVNVRIPVTSAVIFDGKIRATVSDGQSIHRVATGSLSTPNLLPPGAWTLESVGSPQTRPKHLAVLNNKLFVGTSTGLFTLNSGTWVAHDSLVGSDIKAMATSAGVLAVVKANNSVDTISALGQFGRFATTVPFAVTGVVLSAGNKPIVATSGGGLMTYQTTWTSAFPNGPASNQFISIAVDPDGNVWGASGISNGGKGFYRLKDDSWTSFNKQNSPLPFDDYYRVSVGCNGDVWVSSWLRGVVLMPRGANSVDTTKIFGRNVGLSGIPEDSTLVVVGPAICDKNGNTWMSVMKARDKHPLGVRKADGTWTTLACYIAGTPQIYLSEREVTRALAVDASNNIWATAVTDGRKGIVSLNNRGSLTDSVADVFLNSSNGLPSDIVRTIVTDHDNNIWVGTERGIGIILDPNNPTRSGGIASYRPLGGIVINAIAVDPLNQKWIATNEGAILLSRDGTQTLAQYNVATTNGRIIDNEIKDIAVDPNTGIVYFATTKGLASLTTTSVAAKSDFDKITVSPNPYRIPSPIPLTIDGLVENSRIKILTVDGKLVRELQTPGGRIGFWDGKVHSGNDVASRIYIVVAYSETEKDKVGKGKVAILRR